MGDAYYSDGTRWVQIGIPQDALLAMFNNWGSSIIEVIDAQKQDTLPEPTEQDIGLVLGVLGVDNGGDNLDPAYGLVSLAAGPETTVYEPYEGLRLIYGNARPIDGDAAFSPNTIYVQVEDANLSSDFYVGDTVQLGFETYVQIAGPTAELLDDDMLGKIFIAAESGRYVFEAESGQFVIDVTGPPIRAGIYYSDGSGWKLIGLADNAANPFVRQSTLRDELVYVEGRLNVKQDLLPEPTSDKIGKLLAVVYNGYDHSYGLVDPPSGGGGGGGGPLTGAGFPEGVVTAPVGTEYIDTAVTNGALTWRKWSGDGNTGWRVTEGDTGWRNANSFVERTSGGSAATGSPLLVRRVNGDILFQIGGIWLEINDSDNNMNIPAGFRPRYGMSWLWYHWGNGFARGMTYTGQNGEGKSTWERGSFGNGTWPLQAGGYILTNHTYATDDPWPSNLPGTPA